MAWLLLAGAIGTEVVATLALRASAATIRFFPFILVPTGYAVSFVLMALALKTLKVGVVYAIWSGVGTVGVAIAGVLLFGERLNKVAVLGMLLVVAGVIVLTTSGSVKHS
jgi:small multidrug resistance pump